MLIAQFRKETSSGAVRLIVEGALLDGEPVAEITRFNSGPALVLVWPDESIALTNIDADTVLMLALSHASIYESDTKRELTLKPTFHKGYT